MSVVAFHSDAKPRKPEPTALPRYAELAVTTNFSFLRGASNAKELVERARKLGLAGIGIADRNTVVGVVRAYAAVKDFEEREKIERQEKEKNGEKTEEQAEGSKDQIELKLAVGARLAFADGTPDILAYPQNLAAWSRLTQLLTVGKSRAEKGECILFLDDLLEYIAGLNLIVMPPARLDQDALIALLLRLKKAASRRSIWLAATMLYRGDDARRLAGLADIAAGAFVPLIAVNDVVCHEPERRALQDVITCIREHLTLATAGRRLEVNAERHLKAPEEMVRLFEGAPKAISETLRFLRRCQFSLQELAYQYPDETRAGYATPQDALVAFVEEGAKKRYPNGMSAKVQSALNHELAVTDQLKYAPYFLTVHDIVQAARAKGILCQGRGSAANSVICYCLGITEVDPEQIDLLFERFVSAERGEPPDIDVDFEHERREEVIQYIYKKYSRERAGLAATVICYRGRSAIREVGKVFGLSQDSIDVLASTLWGWSTSGVSEQEARRAGLDPSDPRLKQVMDLAKELIGTPRHLSQHVGGFVITQLRLDQIVPVENARMDDRTVVEWDKDDLDEIRILKVDVLGLGMLSCLRRSFDVLRAHYKLQFDLSSFKETEPAVYQMISRADTIGVFQVESRAQMSMLPRLRPEKFYDLVIEVAIVRPGPIQGKMVHPYLQRREKLRDEGIEPEYYGPSPEHGDQDELKEVLKKTLGIPLFQEHAMRLAVVAAKFAPQEADQLRRAMATFRHMGTIKYFKKKFIDGMIRRGYDPTFAARCFDQIKGFGEYGFPESHAASFAILVYISAWIKCHYPDVFLAALLNSQPMGFYATSQLVRDAQEHGVEVRPVDVNCSDWDCMLEHTPPPQGNLHPRHASMRDDILTTHALRLGLCQIDGFSEEWAKIIESKRGRGFDSVRDLWLRTGLPPKALKKLAHADAFNSLGLSRRDALWAVHALQRAGDKDDLPLFARVNMPKLEPDVDLPPMLPGQQVIEDYRHLHLSLKAHPVSFLRADFEARGIVRHDLLPTLVPGRCVTIGGIVLVRQRPGTGNAIFMTLEDETAIANTIVWPRKFEEYRPVVMGARLISVTGVLQNEKGVIHVVANRFEDLTPLLRRLNEDVAGVQTRSRADLVKSDSPDRFRHPRSGDSFVRLAKNQPALEQLAAAEHAAKVMPKGRNFH